MRQVFINLLDNAIRYSPPGGAVTVRVDYEGARVSAAVQDCGRGIPLSDLPHVFERFYRGDRSRRRSDDGSSGSGLGLAIAYALVQAHGGEITIESSSPGVQPSGTTVRFTLPAA